MVNHGPELELRATSSAEAQAWVVALREFIRTSVDDDIKSNLVRELLSDGAARRNLKARMSRGMRKARKAALSVVNPKRPLTEALAATTVQRVYRGHLSRSRVKGWVRIQDDDGDICACGREIRNAFYCAARAHRPPLPPSPFPFCLRLV